MRVKVKLFASLKENIGFSERDLDVAEGRTVRDVWQLVANQEEPFSDVLMAVNMDYARPDAEVKEGDEIAFFPPVTGG
jgi:molybdopterin synthase sulfur carrier subunit